jgi:uncharacterized protein
MIGNVHPGIACNLDSHILSAAVPLLEAAQVEAIEWSFDALFRLKDVPEWFQELLQTFAGAGRLTGHGIYFSIFSAKWSDEQEKWLAHLRALSSDIKFDHISEHFGFMTGEDFHKGAPMSVPLTEATLAIGIDRLRRIQDACHCATGIENLAFAFCEDDVKKHGDFLHQLLVPVNGFLILDLHNLYCQMKNFDLDYEALIGYYPLDRVREIHISGGSWAPAAGAPDEQVRRDTHDDAVPTEVFEMLEHAIPRCPNLKFVILEQLGSGLQTASQKARFRQDYLRMSAVIETASTAGDMAQSNDFRPANPFNNLSLPVEDAVLYEQQIALSHILENAPDCSDASRRLATSVLAGTAWQTEQWPEYMLETALQIAQKWRKGFV